MSGFEPPSSLSSVEALLERKRAANELSELELHLLLKAESLNREKEELRKKLEASELEIERLVARLDTWVGPSPGHGTTSKKRMSDAEPKPSGFRFLGVPHRERHRKREADEERNSDEETDAEIQAVLQQTADLNTKPFSRYTG